MARPKITNEHARRLQSYFYTTTHQRAEIIKKYGSIQDFINKVLKNYKISPLPKDADNV